MGRAGTYRECGPYRAFIPKGLPPDPPITYDNQLIGLLAAAHQALGELRMLASIVPNPDHFMVMYLRKEALLSSQIEGTQASLVDVLAAERGPLGAVPRDVREVVNYVSALKYALKRVSELPFSLRLLKEVHRMLLTGVRGDSSDLGEFRDRQNWLGAPGCSPGEAEFVPPPVEEMKAALDGFERYYHEGSEFPLVKCGLLHAQFETIHPFVDGNGRIGRLLISFFLREQKLLEQPMLYLSYYFKKNRPAYYDSLMAVRNEGDWEGWLKFFLRGVAEAAGLAVTTARRLLELENADRDRVRGSGRSAKARDLYDFLLERPLVGLSEIAEKLKVTHHTARNLVGVLEGCRILTEVTGKKRGRRWAYDPYLRILAEGTTPG